MQRFGRRTWLEQGEAFGVYFGLLAGIAPLTRDANGRVVTQPVLSGLARIEPRPGLLAVITVALGSTTFDGFSRTSLWINATARIGGFARVVVFTAGLLAMIGLVALAFTLAMRAAAKVVGARGTRSRSASRTRSSRSSSPTRSPTTSRSWCSRGSSA